MSHEASGLMLLAEVALMDETQRDLLLNEQSRHNASNSASSQIRSMPPSSSSTLGFEYTFNQVNSQNDDQNHLQTAGLTDQTRSISSAHCSGLDSDAYDSDSYDVPLPQAGYIYPGLIEDVAHLSTERCHPQAGINKTVIEDKTLTHHNIVGKQYRYGDTSTGSSLRDSPTSESSSDFSDDESYHHGASLRPHHADSTPDLPPFASPSSRDLDLGQGKETGVKMTIDEPPSNPFVISDRDLENEDDEFTRTPVNDDLATGILRDLPTLTLESAATSLSTVQDPHFFDQETNNVEESSCYPTISKDTRITPGGSMENDNTHQNELSVELLPQAFNIFGIEPTDLTAVDDDDLDDFPDDMRGQSSLQSASNIKVHVFSLNKTRHADFFDQLSQYTEITIEICKYLRPQDLLSLYSISKPFHQTVNGHLTHAMKSCARYQTPESARIFPFRWYGPLCTPDPVGRLNPDGKVRFVPGLRWLQMVVHRERVVRDILACMARAGHRMPAGMATSLKKLWMLMDVGTSARRVAMMRNEVFWTDIDVYNVQMFIIKLDMRFNDPVDGPADEGMRKLLLGQRGLTLLWKALRRKAFTSVMEVLQAALRYTFRPHAQDEKTAVFGVPYNELGQGHLEGWGAGKIHLLRPDELIVREAVRRDLELEEHLVPMMLWGYVDPVTMQNIQPSEEEMYMSDDEGYFVEYDDRQPQVEDIECDMTPEELREFLVELDVALGRGHVVEDDTEEILES